LVSEVAKGRSRGASLAGVATGSVEAVLVGELDQRVVEFAHAFASKPLANKRGALGGIISLGGPFVSYNLEYDLEEVLKPEWARLAIEPIGVSGFCALRLAQRLLDPVPAGNCKLQTLRQFYRLPERGAHTALGDVQTVSDLVAHVLRPIAERRGLTSWSDVCAYTRAEWFPSRIAFGKFKGRDFRDARRHEPLRDWLNWLANSSNARSASMGRWYLERLNGADREDEDILAFSDVAVEPERSKATSARRCSLSGDAAIPARDDDEAARGRTRVGGVVVTTLSPLLHLSD
jgi:hypothetical protein